MSVAMNNLIVRCDSSELKWTHPSVRLKGAENIYDPVPCQDMTCAKKYVVHMHCPFCIRTDFFTDPVILKAHYRVKHVDKGIEFAGLKIVRCCDHCDIVGSIKGCKEIKGAHWHCFRCKNGFNRRDEALKHYRTHFRNAQTTFQIQITQDVNQSHVIASFPNDTLATSTAQELIAVGEDRCLPVSVAANETVDTTSSGELSTSLMVLPPKNSLMSDVIHADSGHEVNSAIFRLSGEVASSSSSDVWSQQHPQKIDPHQTTIVHSDTEVAAAAQLQIQQLQLQVQKQAVEIDALKRREVELMSRLEVQLDDRIIQLLQKMKTEHEELLHRQLDQLRTEYLRHIAPSPTTTTTTAPTNNCSSHPQPMLILRGYNGQRIQIIPAPTKLTPGFTAFSSTPGLLSSILPGQNGDVDEEDEEEDEEDEKDSGDHVDDGLVSENVQNFIVAADDMSEYVDAEDGGPERAEILRGNDSCDLDRDEDEEEEEVGDVEDGGTLGKRKGDDESDCGMSPKRERLQEL